MRTRRERVDISRLPNMWECPRRKDDLETCPTFNRTSVALRSNAKPAREEFALFVQLNRTVLLHEKRHNPRRYINYLNLCYVRKCLLSSKYLHTKRRIQLKLLECDHDVTALLALLNSRPHPPDRLQPFPSLFG